MDKKQQKVPFFKKLRIYFKEYCNNTSIHGFKYFGENRSYIERGWWFIIFSMTLTACFFAIRMVYQKWVRSPVIVTFATMETPIYSIPFPAVTICPESKSMQLMYSHEAITKSFVNNETLDEDDLQHLKYMGLICDNNTDIKYPQDVFIDDDMYTVMEDLNTANPIQDCNYMGQHLECNKVFVPIITDEGICYTFNAADRSEIFKDNVFQYSNFHQMEQVRKKWTIEEGYSESAGLETYPRRALLSGITHDLSITLMTTFLDVDRTCKSGIQGYKVSLHLPTRIPRPSQEYFRVPDDEMVIAGVQPNMIKTSGRLNDYDVNKRNCYFSYEKQLQYFKIYTPKNCKLECQTNFTLYYCGCVAFFMPRENSTKLCGIGSLECMAYAETKFQLLNLRALLRSSQNNSYLSEKTWPNEGKIFPGDLPHCDCLPTCSDLTYMVETSQSKWDWFSSYSATTKNDTVPLDKDILKFSRLTIFFKNSDFIFSERNELYGPLDFLANLGGLLGLFTGFSVLSVMEAFYFLTLRMFCNARMYGNWAGKDNYSV